MRHSKAEVLRRARSLRADLLTLIEQIEMSGPVPESAERQATYIFERARSLETEVRTVRRRERERSS